MTMAAVQLWYDVVFRPREAPGQTPGAFAMRHIFQQDLVALTSQPIIVSTVEAMGIWL